MSYPLVKFVESPDPAAAVRFDCNRAGEDGVASRKVMAEGFTLGVPTIQGDPDAVGVTYGFRQPFFTERVKGTKMEALAALSSLSRELLRATNWLLVQVDAFTAVRWLKLYRSEFGALSLAEVYVNTRSGDPVLVPDTWDIKVPLVAGPFGYGERVTLDPVTVVQAPSGPNPMRYVLPAIKGDAPVPLRVAISPDSSAEHDAAWLVGCTAGETSMDDPVIDIGTGDGFTAGVGTAAPTADAAYFGGSYREVTISTAGTNSVRLTGTLPAVSLGRYKILLRCEADSASLTTTTYQFQFGTFSDTFPFQYGSVVTLTVNPTASAGAKVFRGWVDLGEFAIPYGTDPRSFSTLPPITNDFGLRIGVVDTAPAEVRIDAFRLIPVQGPPIEQSTLLKAEFLWGGLEDGITGTFDGDLELYQAETATELTPSQVALTGGFPHADPAAAQNLLTVMATSHGDLGATPSITTLDAEAEVVVSYHPLYLHLGDGT